MDSVYIIFDYYDYKGYEQSLNGYVAFADNTDTEVKIKEYLLKRCCDMSLSEAIEDINKTRKVLGADKPKHHMIVDSTLDSLCREETFITKEYDWLVIEKLEVN